MYQFQTNQQGLHLLVEHPHADIINAFLQTDGDNFSDIIEEFIADDTQHEFSGNIFQLIKKQNKIILKDKLSQQHIKMKLPMFVTLFQQWLNQ